MNVRSRARELCEQAAARGDATGWFEALYAEAARGSAIVPWADLVPNPHLSEWLERERPNPISPDGQRKRALDVGCGLGDNAACLAALGFQTTAFDVSKTAIESARQRFPSLGIDFLVDDLLALPSGFDRAFDLVLECYTLQVLAAQVRADAIAALARSLADGGMLLVIARGREPNEPEGSMPWPLTRAELDGCRAHCLSLLSFEDFLDSEEPRVRRFRALWVRG